ncbi:Lactose permease [Grifola frondosa]|uniref:Lactose permease n=1 Tax=Grifola frondosa TaxID=5627 RepID=A0A1C7M6U6_GRIFR|nr:Lactose permease [Grifola frondosa]
MLASSLLTASINVTVPFAGLQILPAWQTFFKHPNGKTLGLISAAQVIGSIVGLPLTPFSSDILGRRPTLFIGSVLMLAGVALQSAATNIGMFIGARGLIGFGITFALNAAPLLITELAYPTQRGKLTSMYNASCLHVNDKLSAAWTCFGAYKGSATSQWSWRVPTLIQALAPVVQIVLIWFIPESPRFLVAKGRESKAASILARYHTTDGDERDPLVMFEMAQIRHALKLEKEVAVSTSFSTLFATPGNRKRMYIIIALATFSQWSGNGLVSYYINLVLEGVGITDAGTKAAINGGLQVWNLMAAMSGALLIDKLGRRTLFIISNVGMLIDFGVWTLTTAIFNTFHNTMAAKATIPFVFIFYLFYAHRLYANAHCIYTGNSAIQHTCEGVCRHELGGLLDSGLQPYLVYCGWLIVELVFTVTYVIETKGRTLEETAALFDGEQQPHEIMQTGGQAATVSMVRSRGPEVWNGDQKNIPVDFLEMRNTRAEGAGEYNRYQRDDSISRADRVYEYAL